MGPPVSRFRLNVPAAALTDRELRLVFGVVAIGDAILAVLFVLLASEEPLVPWVSPVLFSIGALGSLAVAWRPEYRRAFNLSLVGTACALACRAVYVPAAVIAGTRVLSWPRALVGVTVYTGGALAITWVWFRFLQPAIEMRRERRRADRSPR
jgi:hypothetical protein